MDNPHSSGTAVRFNHDCNCNGSFYTGVPGCGRISSRLFPDGDSSRKDTRLPDLRSFLAKCKQYVRQ